MAEHCICYTTDSHYFFPTFVSARQARHNASLQHADVMIFCLDAVGYSRRVMADLCQAAGIGFESVSSAEIDGADAMMARLHLDRIAPSQYRQFLYIDGDTQIISNLDPLLAADVPPGRFMAVKDPLAFSLSADRSGQSRDAEYFRSSGFSAVQERSYFNSGVLRINREGWNEIGQEAWRLFKSMRDQTRFPDQDALNLAGGERHIPMSICWNFPIFLRNSDVDALIEPRIIHYMGRPKPWQGSFLPWGKAGYQPYLDALVEFPDLLPFVEKLPVFRKLKYFGQQHYKRIAERIVWRGGGRSRAMVAYESALREARRA
jgi:lipopolysaccharide biosynthesis glycosyltransferase